MNKHFIIQLFLLLIKDCQSPNYTDESGFCLLEGGADVYGYTIFK